MLAPVRRSSAWWCAVLPAAVLALPAAAAGRVLSLSEALQLAAKQQPSLQQAEALVDAAEGRRWQQRSVLLPQLTGTAVYQRVHGSTRATTSGGSGTAATDVAVSPTTTNIFSAGLNLYQTIWDFGAIERFRAAGHLVDAQRATARATALQVDLQVRATFFQARTYAALAEVARETLDNQVKHQTQVEAFAKVGIRPEIDLAQSRTAVANAQLQLVNAGNNYLLAKAQLRQAVGGIAGDFEVGADELAAVEGESEPLDALTERAVKNRPELAALLLQQDATASAVRAAQGGYLPTLGAAAAVAETGTTLDRLGFNWQFGFTLSWSLFQGGLTAGQVREQRANWNNYDAQVQAQRLAIALQVEQAQLSVQAGLSGLEAARAAEANARLQLQLAEGRYTQGVGSIIELGDAQVAFSTAEAQRAQAQFAISSARAQLLAALGQTP